MNRCPRCKVALLPKSRRELAALPPGSTMVVTCPRCAFPGIVVPDGTVRPIDAKCWETIVAHGDEVDLKISFEQAALEAGCWG